ncbi:cell division protein ZapA [Aliifodinibius sp. S!AR15-10]|uniref:cell division protein ZapA n=1 Tax=Aliifodinibius sp. S!AR15-10 TaxID=2950437 RepID=UPI002863A874|nr:cell division protein ZapA [Aliifodinibius sp. S!AR15-10]MDR8392531.1 cell division protein ZapA [Aliifodinibius sp. S!AR15-10]
MKSIKITILGKQYPIKVEESEEETMRRIAQYVDDRFMQYKKELKKQQETTVMVLAALSLAEEIFEERRRNRELNKKEDKLMQDVNESLEEFIEEISVSQ